MWYIVASVFVGIIVAAILVCVVYVVVGLVRSRPRNLDFDADQSPFDYAEPLSRQDRHDDEAS